jgi:hypothetical protein
MCRQCSRPWQRGGRLRPNTGYGGFGAEVTIDRAPHFDNERRFDPRRILLTDIDGSRTADLQPPT